MSMLDVAKELGWSESKVSRLETGQRPLSAEEIAAFLAVLRVTGEQRDRLMAMARTPDEPAWLDTIRSGLTGDSVTLATYEADATAVTDWSPLLIPGLLQTMDYGRAYMLADRIPETDIGVRLMARQHRQTILDRVDYVAFIDEPVLRRRVGDERVRRNQLRHLLDMADHERVAIRVVPVNSDAHSGLISPFMMLEFADAPPIVHIELPRSGVFMIDPSETDHFVGIRAQLLSRSLDEADSYRVIERILGEKGQ
ncbi:MAG: helix-turn-helix domain-containing protein [Saccharothrix sp.]|nr:helix-turn-helix domain-containing protein [Saccharothrix sp.]